MHTSVTRRSFLGAAAASSLAVATAQKKSIPVGLELYSVREALQKDLPGTVRQVAQLGYQDVEFFSPYYNWTTDYAKEVRELLDGEGTMARALLRALPLLGRMLIARWCDYRRGDLPDGRILELARPLSPENCAEAAAP